MPLKGGDNAIKKRRTRGETWAPSWFSEMQATALILSGWRFTSTRLEHGCCYLSLRSIERRAWGRSVLRVAAVRGAGPAKDGNASALRPYYSTSRGRVTASALHNAA